MAHARGARIERFSAKVECNGPLPAGRPDLGRCWSWLGYHKPNGYGQFNVARGVSVLAHRFAYELHHGVRLPGRESGMELDHLCRNRGCVNPAHLEWVSKAENIRRGDSGKQWAAKTHCPAGHIYDEPNTYVHGGRRFCRACAQRRRREHRARKAA